jgi:hypothetical protein
LPSAREDIPAGLLWAKGEVNHWIQTLKEEALLVVIAHRDVDIIEHHWNIEVVTTVCTCIQQTSHSQQGTKGASEGLLLVAAILQRQNAKQQLYCA